MRPTRPLPRVGMEVVVLHLGAREPGVIEAVRDDGRTLVVGGVAFTLRVNNGRFVRAGDPPFGVRLVLAPANDGAPRV